MLQRSKHDIIKDLAAIDLASYPDIVVRNLIAQLDPYGTMLVKVPRGRVLVRARPNFNGEEFSNVSDLSYVPKEKNLHYRRASTPYNTMFYGSIFPDELYGGSIDTSRLIGVCEVCSLLRDKTIYEGEETLTFGRWNVTNDIPVCAVIHNKNHLAKNPLIKKIFSNYNEFLSGYKSGLIDEFNYALGFLADQFAKEVTIEYNYMISAFYAERMSNLVINNTLIGGVMYPSVKTEGEGLNIAISPWYADNCLQLVAVVECTVYKKGNNVVIGNNKVVVLNPGERIFELERIKDPKEYISREMAIRYLSGL